MSTPKAQNYGITPKGEEYLKELRRRMDTQMDRIQEYAAKHGTTPKKVMVEGDAPFTLTEVTVSPRAARQHWFHTHARRAYLLERIANEQDPLEVDEHIRRWPKRARVFRNTMQKQLDFLLRSNYIEGGD